MASKTCPPCTHTCRQGRDCPARKRADDTMTVTPPAGFIAYPAEVTVPEGGAGVILILEEAVS